MARVSSDALAKAVAAVSRFVSPDVTNRALSGVLLRAGEGTLALEATDGTRCARHVMPADSDEPFEAVVPGKALASLVKVMPDGAVEVTRDGTQTVMECGSSRSALATLDPSEWPAWPEVATGPEIVVDADVLVPMASAAARLTCDEPSKPALAGVRFEASDGVLRMMSAGSFSMCVLEADCGCDGFSALVHGQTVRDMLPYLSGRVTVSSSGSLASFESGMTRYVSRLVRGNFPDLLGLFPSGASSTFTLDSDELSQAVSRVSVMAVGTMAVTISSGGGEVRLGCATADYGSSEEVVAADCDGEARVMLNAKYLRQVLAACHGEVRVGIGGPLAPVTFDGLGSIRSRCMLMPVRG